MGLPVERAGARHGSADDADIQRRGVGRQALQVLLGAIQEALLFEQVARRITGEGKFGEDHHVAPASAACRENARMRLALPQRSPTVLLVCARAIFMGKTPF